jgi:hypothetical protein
MDMASDVVDRNGDAVPRGSYVATFVSLIGTGEPACACVVTMSLFEFLLTWGGGSALVSALNWIIDRKTPQLDPKVYAWAMSDRRWRSLVILVTWWLSILSLLLGGVGYMVTRG